MDAARDHDLGLVVHIQPDQRGVWSVQINGSIPAMVLELQPAQFIIRLHRVGNNGALRGIIHMPAHNLATPIQCNVNANALFRAWLLKDNGTNPAE